MKHLRFSSLWAFPFLLLLVQACQRESTAPVESQSQTAQPAGKINGAGNSLASVSVFATGLNNPVA